MKMADVMDIKNLGIKLDFIQLMTRETVIAFNVLLTDPKGPNL